MASVRSRVRPAARELAGLLLGGAAGAGVVLLASRQGLARVIVRPPRPLPATVTVLSGQDLRPAIAALAVAALASLAAVLATRGLLRRLTGLVTIALGAGIGAARGREGHDGAALAAAGRSGASPASGAGAGTAAGSVTAGTGSGGTVGSLAGFGSHVVLGGRLARADGRGRADHRGRARGPGAGGSLPAMSARYDGSDQAPRLPPDRRAASDLGAARGCRAVGGPR